MHPVENDNPITQWKDRVETGVNRAIWWKNVGQWTYNHWKPLLATGCATSIAAGLACYKLHQKGINSTNCLAMGLCGYTFYWYISDQETKELIVKSTNRLLEHQDAVEQRTDVKLRIIYNRSEQHQRDTQKKIDELNKNLHHALFASEIKIRAHISKESARLHFALAEHKQDILAQITEKSRNTTQNFIKLHQEVVGVGQFAQVQSHQMQSNIAALGNALPKIQNSLSASTNHTGKNMQQMLQAMAQAQGLQVDLESEPFIADEDLNIDLTPPSDYEPIIQEKFAQLEAAYEKTIATEEAKMEEKIKRKREKLLHQKQLFTEELERKYHERIESLALNHAQENRLNPFDAIPEVKQFEAPTPLHAHIRRITPFALQAIAPGTSFVLEKLLARYWHHTH